MPKVHVAEDLEQKHSIHDEEVKKYDRGDSAFFSGRQEISEIGKPPLAAKKQPSADPGDNSKTHNSILRSESSSGNGTKTQQEKT